MANKTVFRSFRRASGEPIPGGSRIVAIINNSVASGFYTIIKMPDNTGCKAVFCKLRSGGSWRAKVIGSSDYITVEDVLSIDIALIAGENLFQVQTEAGNDTFEVMVLD